MERMTRMIGYEHFQPSWGGFQLTSIQNWTLLRKHNGKILEQPLKRSLDYYEMTMK